jgi:hypothetical protein
VDADHVLVLSDTVLTEYVGRVLEMFPDVPRDRVENLVRMHHPLHGVHVLEPVLHVLLDEMQLSVGPKIDKGKRKRDEEHQDEATEDRISTRVKIDYSSSDRACSGGPHYAKLACVGVFHTSTWAHLIVIIGSTS